MQDLQLSQSGEIYVFEYSLTIKGKDPEMVQHHVHAQMVHDGVWFDFHLSRLSYPPYDPNDRQVFLTFLNSVQLVPAAGR